MNSRNMLAAYVPYKQLTLAILHRKPTMCEIASQTTSCPCKAKWSGNGAFLDFKDYCYKLGRALNANMSTLMNDTFA